MDMKHAATRLLPAMLTLTFAVAVAGFFGFKYLYHLHYQEQFQLFQFTWKYFAEVVSVPGGLSDWVGRFITQFFYQARIGAILIALLLSAIQLATWGLMKRTFSKELRIANTNSSGHSSIAFYFYSLSFIPAVLGMMFYCDEHAILGTLVALLTALFASLCVLRLQGEAPQSVLYFIGVPVLYFVCGPMAVVLALIVPMKMKRGWMFMIGGIVLMVVCLLGSSWIFPYPIRRLIIGLHYHRYPYVLPGWAWLAALTTLVLAAIPKIVMNSKGQSLGIPSRLKMATGLALGIAVATGAFWGVRRMADFTKEEAMKYDFMAHMQMWNRLMMTADVKAPSTPMTVTCLNLALAKTGRMGDHMFDYFQNGPDGLLPPFVRDFTSPLPTSEAYYHLGMVNTAQRFVFEAQEGVPDFQRSARCYRRLAETNIINGDYDVARRYLVPLCHTLFYRRWAQATLSLLGDEDAIDRHPQYGTLRRMRLHDHDFLFSEGEMDSMLGLLVVENKDNDMAFQYLLAWSLLRGDLNRFAECLRLRPMNNLPRHWQEAMLLLWTQTHDNQTGIPPYLSPQNAAHMQAFAQAVRNGKPDSYMRSHFGNTCWYYLFYRK